MIIKNAKVFLPDCRFARADIRIRDGRIAGIEEYTPDAGEAGICKADEVEEILDGSGCLAIPGLIDLHFHGCLGYDIGDATEEAFREIALYEASVGVTAMAPATLTQPVPELDRILTGAAAYARHPAEDGADLVGINMEGPFISREKKGAQDEANLLPCSAELAKRFVEESEGLVRVIGLAPEVNPAFEAYIRSVRDFVHVSLAHSNCDYETAMRAIAAGADHAVHLFNAMPEFLHRSPGIIGAVADSPRVYAELITDGIHVHPSVVRAAFRLVGEGHLVLISDSLRATGMEDGDYTIGDLSFHKEGKRCTMARDGAIAGSVTNLTDCMRTAVRDMNIPLEQAVAAATVNPARCLGIEAEYGELSPGRRADIVLLEDTPELALRVVIKDGRKLS